MKPAASLFLLLFLSVDVWAQDAPARKWWHRFHPDSLLKRDVKFIPIPVIQSSPETGLKGGLAIDYFFNTGSSDSTKPTRDSYAWVQALYSTRRQLILEPFWQIYTRDERYFLRGRGGYLDFSEYVWGVGQETVDKKAYDNVLYNRIYLQTKVLRKLYGRTFLGVNYNYSDTRNIRFPAGSDILPTLQSGTGDTPGLTQSRVSGLGPNIVFDYRNNAFSPTQGWYGEYAVHFYTDELGSGHSYTEHQVDVRKYFPWRGRNLLGFQVVAHLNEGAVPLRELPRLGGPFIMRGMISGRYRDRQMVAAQAEYRRAFNRFLGGAVFGAVGGVAPTLAGLADAKAQVTGGAGLRLLLNRKKNLYARVDLATSSDRNLAVYFRVMDAF